MVIELEGGIRVGGYRTVSIDGTKGSLFYDYNAFIFRLEPVGAGNSKMLDNKVRTVNSPSPYQLQLVINDRYISFSTDLTMWENNGVPRVSTKRSNYRTYIDGVLPGKNTGLSGDITQDYHNVSRLVGLLVHPSS